MLNGKWLSVIISDVSDMKNKNSFEKSMKISHVNQWWKIISDDV